MTSDTGICAMVITYNEQENIHRTLASIAWLDDILVVDSGSTDGTLEIVAQFPQARVVQRKFTTFAEQCNFGLECIATPWVLSMDADYRLPAEAREVVTDAVARGSADGYQAGFFYAIHGKVVKGSILPPRTILYRRQRARYEDDGHGHGVQICGCVERLPFRIIHDDRKPLIRWATSQIKYAAQEADKLLATPAQQLSRQDRLRRLAVVAPLVVFVLVYVVRGGFLSGWQGFYYALQRTTFEMLLSLSLIERKIRR
ncbi:MAG: glycosyltransferase family 2 protein [Halioglobus sp.]|nr:glycosyltransferase family 2 protein [Halioglobus sp.]